MNQNNTNVENELDETVENEEEVKSGLKIRTNLKAGMAISQPRGGTGHGETVSGALVANGGALAIDVLENIQVANKVIIG